MEIAVSAFFEQEKKEDPTKDSEAPICNSHANDGFHCHTPPADSMPFSINV